MPVGPTKAEKKTDKRYYLSRDCIQAIFSGNYDEAQQYLHEVHLEESKFYALTALNEPDFYSSFILTYFEKDSKNSAFEKAIKADIHFDNFFTADNDEALLTKYGLFKANNDSKDNEEKKEPLPKELKKVVKKYNALSSGEQKILKYKAKLFADGDDSIDFGKVFEEMKNAFTSIDTEGNKMLAEMYLKGIGTKPDLKKAIEKQQVVVNSIKFDEKKMSGKHNEAQRQKKLQKALETINLAKLQLYLNKSKDSEMSFNEAERLLCELVNYSATQEFIFPLVALYVHLYCRCIRANEFDKAADYFNKFFSLSRQLDKKQMKICLECFYKVTDLSKMRAKVLFILTQIQSGKLVHAPTSDELNGSAIFNIERDGHNRTEDIDFKINVTSNYEDDMILSNPLFNDAFFVGSLYSQTSAFRSAAKYYEVLKKSNGAKVDEIDMLTANCLYAAGDADGAKKLYKELYKKNVKIAPNPNTDPIAFILDNRYTFANVLFKGKGRKARKLFKELSKEYKECNAIKEKLKHIKKRCAIAVLLVIAIVLCVVAATVPYVVDKI